MSRTAKKVAKKVAKATRTKKTPPVEGPAPKTRRPTPAKTDDDVVIRAKTIVKDTLVPVMNETTIKREMAFDASELGWKPGKFPPTLKHANKTYTKDAAYPRPGTTEVGYVDYVRRDSKGNLIEIIPVFND